MLKPMRMFLLSGTLAVTLAAAPWMARAQSADSLPANISAALQAPGANVEAVALSLAQANPAYATAVLQTAINILGGNSAASADLLKAFADQANALLQSNDSSDNAALAAALAVAVANVVGDPQNAALVNGPFAQVVTEATAAVNTVLQNNLVQQAILAGAPGTQQTLLAANNAPPGSQNFTPNSNPGLGSSPAHP